MKWLPLTTYASICADVLSLNGLEGVSVSSISSLSDANCGEHSSLVDQMQKPGDLSTGNSAHNYASEATRNSNSQVLNSEDVNPQSKSDGPSNEAKQPVFLDDIASSADEGSGKEVRLLDNCGILPSNCLPCLASTVPSVEKRRPLSSSPPSARKKTSLKLSFKWREGHSNAALCEYLCYPLNINLLNCLITGLLDPCEMVFSEAGMSFDDVAALIRFISSDLSKDIRILFSQNHLKQEYVDTEAKAVCFCYGCLLINVCYHLESFLESSNVA